MTQEEILDREYTRVKESLEQIASIEVLELVHELEMILEGQSIAKELKELQEDYRTTKEGI